MNVIYLKRNSVIKHLMDMQPPAYRDNQENVVDLVSLCGFLNRQ